MSNVALVMLYTLFQMDSRSTCPLSGALWRKVDDATTFSCFQTLKSCFTDNSVLDDSGIVSILNSLGRCSETESIKAADFDMAIEILVMLSKSRIEPTSRSRNVSKVIKEFANTFNQILKSFAGEDLTDPISGKLPMSSVFLAVETFVGTLALQELVMEEDTSVYYSEELIDVGILVVDEKDKEVMKNLSTAVFDIDFTAHVLRERSVAVVLYKGMEQVISEDQLDSSLYTNNEGVPVVYVWSDILSASVYSLAEEEEEIINISMTFNVEELPNNSVGKCAYWRFDDSGKTGGQWSTDGCMVSFQTNDSVSCVCHHLTNFAILVQVVDTELSSADQKALRVISYVGCLVSICGASLSIFTFRFLRMYKDRCLIHLNLAVAIIGAQVMFMTEEGVPKQTAGCVVTVILLYYFNMAVFCWMLAEGIHIYLTAVQVFTTGNNMKFYYIAGWGGPLAIVVIGIAIVNSNIGQHDVCWLSPKDNSILAFVIPAMVVVFINGIILVLVMRVIIRLNQSSVDGKLKRIGKTVKASLLLLPILGVTWVLGVFAVSKETVLFQYLFTVTNSLQGLMLFLCHCVNNSEIREAFIREKNSWMISRHIGLKGRVHPCRSKIPTNSELATVAVTDNSKVLPDERTE